MIIKFRLAFALCSSVSLVSSVLGYAQMAPLTPSASAAQEAPAQVQQLVAPIALYPDSLVAQILAASTYPGQVGEAQRWITQHPGLQGQQLADQVNAQPWDPSVKAMTAFPSVLASMSSNLSWTTALGEAYITNSQGVMNEIQDLRHKAQEAGNLQNTSQQTMTTEGAQIVIQPTSPELVYVPQYDPWRIYGPVIDAWPGWYSSPGLYVTSPGVFFSVGIGIGVFAGFGWGWHNWGFDWAHRAVVFNHRTFISRNTWIINHRVTIRNPHDGSRHATEPHTSGSHPVHRTEPHGGGPRHAGAPHHPTTPHHPSAPHRPRAPHHAAPHHSEGEHGRR